MKTYIGISRDHSGSMSHIARAAAKDYDVTIASIKENTVVQGQDTIVSVVECGVHDNTQRRTVNRWAAQNSSIGALRPFKDKSYETSGGNTPLFDSVSMLITSMQNVPDAHDPDVAFLVMVITDGGDNSSSMHGRDLGVKIQQLQRTDKWTFTFRVPYGGKSTLVRLGIPAANILEWEQTERGFERATGSTQSAVGSYYAARGRGETYTNSFYSTDLSNVPKAEVKKALNDITSQVKVLAVSARDDRKEIRDFVEQRLSKKIALGAAFYQLTKRENEVQEGKLLAVRDKKNGKIFAGTGARDVLGLPHQGTLRLVPGDHGDFELYVQSKSVNRKLVGGTNVLYWNNVGGPT